MKCFVYRNLHKPNDWYSLKATEGPFKGKVIGYASMLVIDAAEMRVSEAGRQRVLTTGHKNVHAGIVGEVIGAQNFQPRLPVTLPTDMCWYDNCLEQISYNPYKHPTFVVRKTGKPVHRADRVVFNGGLVEAFGIT